MALNFKQISKRPNPKIKSRNSKRYQKLEGRHIPKRILMDNTFIGDWYHYPRVNMVSWLARQVDRPIDMVFSDFIKEYKKTYRGSMSPEEFFYKHVDRKKEQHKRFYGTKYYVSESGFLCRYSKYSSNTYKMQKETPSHVDYNKKVLKDIEIGENEHGPKYLGKVWVKTKSITKLANVWMVSEDKWNGRKDCRWSGLYPFSMKNYLCNFSWVTIEGYGNCHYKEVPQYLNFTITRTYRFISKLSDLQ